MLERSSGNPDKFVMDDSDDDDEEKKDDSTKVEKIVDVSF